MLKRQAIGILLTICLLVSGCVTSAKYDFGQIQPDSYFDLVDARPDSDKAYHEGCKMLRDPVDNLGDESFIPSKLDVLRSALNNQLIVDLGGGVKVNRFVLKLVYPNQCGVSRAAAAASVSYPAAIAIESSRSREDGVLCEIELEVSGSIYSGVAYVPAGEAIRSLFGISVDPSELVQPLRSVTQKCVNQAFTTGHNKSFKDPAAAQLQDGHYVAADDAPL